MSKYPQDQGRIFLTDGGMETTLVFHDGIDLPVFSSIVMMTTDEKKAHLKEYYKPYLQLAARHQTGFILESPTWRSSYGWAEELGKSEAELDELNHAAIRLLHEIRRENESNVSDIVVSGCIGPRGDGYVVSKKMTADEAEEYHSRQISIFAGEAVDCVSAYTLNYVEEAIGITRAARVYNVPSVISFTVETDGCLVTGQSLKEAIEEVDRATDRAPAYYMINCAHPSHFSHILSEGLWLSRIGGIQANASPCSHEELDNAEVLDIGNPIELAGDYVNLREKLPNLAVFGGCCGTDLRHITAIADRLKERAAA